jgi:hypothetical protein
MTTKTNLLTSSTPSTMPKRICDYCGDPRVDCPNCNNSVHLDELLGEGCVYCKPKSSSFPAPSHPS